LELTQKIKTDMIREAEGKYKTISPCFKAKTFKDSFTEYKDQVYFWFNDAEQSTHVIKRKKNVQS
jgi:hypothetical protein